MELGDDVEDLLHQNGSKTHGGLVEHQQLGMADEGSAHGQHLLLAAGEGSGDLALALQKPGEAGKDVVQLGLGGAFVDVSAHLQVFKDGHLEENPPPLGDVGKPLVDQLVALGVGDVLAQKLNGAGAGAEHAGNGFEGGGLACAIGADERHHLAGLDLEGDVLEGMDFAVVDVDIINLEHCPCLPSCRGMPR